MKNILIVVSLLCIGCSSFVYKDPSESWEIAEYKTSQAVRQIFGDPTSVIPYPKEIPPVKIYVYHKYDSSNGFYGLGAYNNLTETVCFVIDWEKDIVISIYKNTIDGNKTTLWESKTDH